MQELILTRANMRSGENVMRIINNAARRRIELSSSKKMRAGERERERKRKKRFPFINF